MKCNRKFTLIELLVVIAIIAILASILVPALSRARYKAKLVLCTNNQKQLAEIVYMYADDFDGQLIPYKVNGDYNMAEPNWSRTFWEGATDSTRVNLGIPYKLGYFGAAESLCFCPVQTHPGWSYDTYAPFPTAGTPTGTTWSPRIRAGYNYNPWRSDPSSTAPRYTRMARLDGESILTVDLLSQIISYPTAAPHRRLPSITYSRGDGSVVTNRNRETYLLAIMMDDNRTRFYTLLKSLTSTE